MPNQKSNKGKRNKRTNSSGDEQENGASASSVTGGTASVLTGATAGPPSDNRSGKNVTSVNVLPNGTFLWTCARVTFLLMFPRLQQLVLCACHHHQNCYDIA